MKLLKESKTLPVDFVDNRIIVQPVTKNGKTLNILTDTGGGLILSLDATQRANLPISIEIIDSKEIQAVDLPEFIESRWIPPLSGQYRKMRVFSGDFVGEAGFLQEVDGLLGQAWFGNRIWTFDYLKKEMLYHELLDYTHMDQTHSVKLWFQKDDKGNQTNHFPRIQASVDGEILDFLFDTGATIRLSENGFIHLNEHGGRHIGTCFITENKFNQWKEHHPDWRIIENAEEDTDFPIIEVPEVTIAGYAVGPVWFTYRNNSSFHWYMAQMMDKEVEGALGGSLFQYFKITVDYPNGTAYFER